MKDDNWMRDMHPNLPNDGWPSRSDILPLSAIIILGLVIGLVGGIEWSQPVVFLP